jgi:hypothetical protein
MTRTCPSRRRAAKAQAAIALAAAAAAMLCSAAPLPAAAHDAPAEPAEDVARLEALIRHAETYYWFGMAEKGNRQAFGRGLELAAEAARLRSRLAARGALAGARSAALSRRLEGVRQDLEYQDGLAADTLWGVFPLVRLLTPSLFHDWEAAGTFDLLDHPDDVATRDAARALVDSVLEKWTTRPQSEVVFTSVPFNPDLNNEALYVFNTSPKVFVHNYREVCDALSPEQLEDFRRDRITPAIVQRLCEAFGIHELLVVSIRRLDVVGDEHFYLAEGRLYAAGTEVPLHSLFEYGFCRERHHLLGPIILINVALFLLAGPLFALVYRARHAEWPAASKVALRSVLAFVLGRALPWVFVPLLGAVAPQPEALAIVGFWWPCFVALVLLLAPVVVYRIVTAKLGGLSASLRLHGWGGEVAVAAALGACAYLAGPMLLFGGGGAAALVVPLVLAAAPAAFLFGRVADAHDPLTAPHVFLPVALALAIGAAWALLSGLGLSVLTVAGAVGVASLSAVRRRAAAAAAEAGAVAPPGELPADLDDLVARAEEPAYLPFEEAEAAWKLMSPAAEGRTAWVGLTGGEGTGKTALLDHLAAELESALGAGGRSLRTLRGRCGEAFGKGVPYAPFREALAETPCLRILEAPEGGGAEAEALGQILEWIPGGGLLGQASVENMTKEERFAAVANYIRRQARRQRVLLAIDDAQWIDQASAELTAFFLRRFQPGEPLPLAIVVASRDTKTLASLDLPRSATIDVAGGRGPAGAARMADHGRRILVERLGLSEAAADAVLAHVGRQGLERQGGLLWVLKTVSSAAREGALSRGSDGRFELAAAYRRGRTLPVPDELQAYCARQVEPLTGEEKALLRLAACVGPEFPVSLLARSLHTDPDDLAAALDALAEKTDILVDEEADDDLFAFSSLSMYDAIRRMMKITGNGPLKPSPEVVRRAHARLALALEDLSRREGERPKQMSFQLASNFYAAGGRYADKGMEYCLEACREAARQFAHDTAARFLQMARECGEARKAAYDFDFEAVRLRCQKAHVTGAERTQAADEAGQYVEQIGEGPPAAALIVAARACYDAAGEDRRYREEAVRLGRQAADAAETDLQRAEACHIVGVALGLSADAAARQEARAELERALELAASGGDDRPALVLTSQVLDSLAGLLAGERPPRPEEARRKYEQSEEIKLRLKDLPGLARTYGGLGRLALASEPADVAAARRYFEKDLGISRDIDDVNGQSQMLSHLGACDLLEGRWDDAAKRYREAWRIAEESGSASNTFFAQVGCVEAALAAGRADDAENCAKALLDLAAEHRIPLEAASRLTAALERWSPEGGWAERVRAAVGGGGAGD